MREKLSQYVELLFAGASDAEEMKQEILHNTLDRYDDLVAQGKSPEAAYRLAISGIGDIEEILQQKTTASYSRESAGTFPMEDENPPKQNYRAIAIAMYILCPVPLFILNEFGLSTLGLCLTLALVATATYVIILSKKPHEKNIHTSEYSQEPELTSTILKKKAIDRVLWSVCAVVYLLVSFLTGAWYITWILFPIFGCVRGLIHAVIDLKEVMQNED